MNIEALYRWLVNKHKDVFMEFYRTNSPENYKTLTNWLKDKHPELLALFILTQ